jgi:hypothetical protein
MSASDVKNDPSKYYPKFLVTQEEYDRATPEERTQYNYSVVDDKPIELPPTFNIPKGNCEFGEL